MSNNCYLLRRLAIYIYTDKALDEFKLWHRHFSHINTSSFNNTIKASVIRRLLEISHQISVTCGPCQMGKQVRTSHNQRQ